MNGSISGVSAAFIQNDNVSLAASISPTIAIQKIRLTIDLLVTLEKERTQDLLTVELKPQLNRFLESEKIIDIDNAENEDSKSLEVRNAAIWRHLRRPIPTPPAPIPAPPSIQLSFLSSTQKIQLVDELLEALERERIIIPLAKELRSHLGNFLESKRIISILKGEALKPEDPTAVTWKRLRRPIPTPLKPIPSKKIDC